MSDQTPANQRLRRRWPFVLAGLLLLTAAVLVAIPYGIRWQALEWLRDHGHPTADLDDVDFNPFSGRLALLTLGGGTGKGEELSLNQIAVQVDWLPFLGRRVLVKDIAVDRVAIDVERKADGTLVVGRVELPPAEGGKPDGADPEEPWLIGLGNVDLKDVTVRYTDPLVDTSLVVKELHIDPAFQWEPDRPTAFHAELELDGESWSLDGTAKPFADAPSVDVKINLRGQVQRRYPRLLANLGVEEFTLRADTDGHLQARFAPETGEIEVRHQSRLELREVAFATADIRGNAGSLSWDGTITVGGTTGAPEINLNGTLDLRETAVAAPAEGLAHAGFAALTVDMEDLRVTLAEEPAALNLAGNLGLVLANLGVEHDQATATLETLTWKGEPALAGAAAGPSLTVPGELELSGLAATVPSGPEIHQGDLTWRGEVRYESETEERPLRAEASGTLALRDTRATALGDTVSSAGLEALDLELAPLRVILPADGSPGVNHEGGLRVTGARAVLPGTGGLDGADLTWEGAVSLGTGEGTRVEVAGEAALLNLAAHLLEPALGLGLPSLRWGGSAAYFQPPGDSPPGLKGAGNLEAGNLAVTNRDSKLALLGLDRLEVSDAAVEALDRATVGRIRLGGLRALQNAPDAGAGETATGGHVLSLGELEIAEVTVDGPGRIEIGSLRLQDLETWLTRSADGEMAFLDAMPAGAEGGDPPEAAEPSPENATGPGTTVRLGEAHLVGENRLAYLDHTVDPPYQFEITPFEIHLEGVDSGDAEGLSPLSLRARTGRYSTIEVDGQVGLFAARPTLNLTGQIRGVNLAPATALAQRHTGYRIRSGSLDADLRVDIDQGILDSLTELTANKLEMVKLDPEKLDALDQELGLPLNAALDLLRDSDDNIQLDIPVEGDLSNPQIDIGHAVRTAVVAGMTKAISTGALTYLATLGSAVFLPVGAAVAAGKVISLATALNFAPVPFPAGEAAVPDDVREQLDTLASLLGERPKLRLTLCGYAAPMDRLLAQAAELHRRKERAAPAPPPPQPHPPVDPVELPQIPEQQLLDLATARGEAVMEYLVESGGVDPGRLLVCSPELAEDEDASPRVDVSL